MSEKSEQSTVGLFLNVASLGAGACNGYCDAQGIVLSDKMEFATKWGPTLVQGAIGAIGGGLRGLVLGSAAGGAVGVSAAGPEKRWRFDDCGDIESCRTRDKSVGREVAYGLGGVAVGGAVGTVGGAALAGGLGAAKGAILTLVGYGIGYFSGWLMK